MMKKHLELVKVKPTLSLSDGEVMIEVSGSESKGVKLLVWCQKEDCWCFLVVDTGVISLPLPHDVDLVRIRCEAVRVAAVCGPCNKI